MATDPKTFTDKILADEKLGLTPNPAGQPFNPGIGGTGVVGNPGTTHGK